MENQKERLKSKIGIGSEICIWQNNENCKNCELDEKLFCHPKGKYILYFAGPLFIGLVPMIILTLFSALPLTFKIIFFGSWFIYSMFFFNFWETRILCNHCPYYANESQRVLHCAIDKGKYKAGTYDPGPLSKSERIQFTIGVILFVGFPIPFLIYGNLLITLAIYFSSVFIWLLVIQRKVCTDCINFACPLNRVPISIRDEFIKKNPIIREAWEKSGYKFE